jgi:hypothetical protein
MALTLPPLPGLPGLPNFGTGPVDDLLGKDQKVKLSDLLAKHDWGSPNSEMNRRARGVIQCESKGDTDAYNDAPCGKGENAVGLMQVCTIHRGTRGIPKDKDKAVEYLKNADNNVRVGREIWKSQGWGAWACPVVETDWNPEITVKKGTLTGTVSDKVDAVVDPLVKPFETVAEFFGLLAQSSTWLRVGKVLLGAALLGVGVLALVLVAIREVGAPVAKTVAKVTPAGKVSNVAKAVA